jgi:hypothetical protein
MKATARRVLSAVGVSLLVTFIACAKAETLCTPENSGVGGQPRVVFAELPGTTDKATCDPHLEIVRTEADLRRVYLAAGVPLAGEADAGPPSEEQLALPAVDFTQQVVLVREATDDQSVAWVVAQGDALTVGTQGCIGFGSGTCRTQFFTLDIAGSRPTTATAHACENIGCGGPPQNLESR